jgi:hypothetical protein
MIRRKKIPFDELFRGRRALKKYLRRAPNGCLIYHGPMKGRTPGNPLVGVNGGKTTESLRSWIWREHNGKRPRGVFLWMTCGNGMCFEYDHMEPRRGARPRYAPMRSEYLVRCTPLQIRTALYFKGKLSQTVLGRLVGLRPEVVFGICERSAVHAKIKTPKGWQPDKVVIRKAETEALTQRKIYLGPKSLREALEDIERSSLDPDRKQLAVRFIQGETTKKLHGDFRLSQGGVMYVYRRTLADLYRELGYRPWMRLASKGVISH